MKSSLVSFTLHLLALTLILFSYEPKEPKVTHKLAVQTVKLYPVKAVEEVAVNSEEVVPAPPAPPEPSPASVPVSTPAPVVKKETKPVEKKTKAPPPSEKKDQKEKKGPCLTDAQKKKIQSAMQKPGGAKKGATLANLATGDTTESGYGDLLGAALQNRLSLAVGGSVKVSLTLSREGKVKKLTILSAANEENRKKIETNLKEATLIPFGSYFPGEKEHEFVILLSGD